MALSRIDTTNMIENVPQSKIDNNINFRNILINGDMSIAQRGTSVTGRTGGGYLVCDRYNANIYNAGTWSLSQSTDVPSGQGFAKSFKWDCTTADASLASTDDVAFEQRVEGQNLQYLKKGTVNAESLTLSFWVKSNKTGTYCINLLDADNSSRFIAKSYTINLANTWEKKILTFAGDTSGAFDNDNGFSLLIQWKLAAGSGQTSGSLQTSWGAYDATKRAEGQVNLADSTSNEWYITGVQLEAGTTASDFEFLPVDVNLGRCQRYFNYTKTAVGYFSANDIGPYGYGMVSANFPTTMRTNPTMTNSSLDTAGTGSYHGQFSNISSYGYWQKIQNSSNQIYGIAENTADAEL